MTESQIIFFLEGAGIYFFTINILYGILLILSWTKIRQYVRMSKKEKILPALPGVSFIVPAFNEESLIVETIQTYVSLTIEKEIIIVNDGSMDATFVLLQNMYQLMRDQNSQGVVYNSITHPEIKVVQGMHKGKAEALNLGIQFAKFGIVCTMDADTIPQAQGVRACLDAFARDTNLIAAGGVIQVLGSDYLYQNAPTKKLTFTWLSGFQRIEYLRTFVCERLGWSFLDSTLLISGAFCMLKREALIEVGGYNPASITEDLDIIVRLRRKFAAAKYKFVTLPVTVCYTQVPSSLSHLRSQRIRWQLGLIQTLAQHLSLIFNPLHGLLGLFAVPYFWIVEALSPLIEAMTFFLVPYALYHNMIDWHPVLFYLTAGLLFNLLITAASIHLDNKYVTRSDSWSVSQGLFHTICLYVGFKQLNSGWRFIALGKSLVTKGAWGIKNRGEITHHHS